MSITVAIPTHRRAHYLRSALASVASQTRLPDEVIVCEDGSDSETLGVVDSYRSSLPIVHIRNDPPLGEMGNRFLGLTSGESSRVAMLDDDDEWESVFLERADDALERHPECGFFSSDHFIVDQDGMILELATEQASRRFGRVGMRTGVYHDVLYRHLARTSFSLNTSLFRREYLLQ